MRPVLIAVLVLAVATIQVCRGNPLLVGGISGDHSFQSRSESAREAVEREAISQQEQEARDRRLLGSLLGGVLGGGGGKEGGGGGLLGGLLGGGKGGGGLLGGLLGGKGGLLGGVLGGGGGGGGGLLGGLLGGVLGGVLGGGKEGGGGGLLGGLLGEGGIGSVLNNLVCLIESLGLSVVLDLLSGVGADKILGLNELACLLPANSTGILEELIELLGPDLVIEAGVDAVLRLEKFLGAEGVEVKVFIEKVLCLIKQVGLADAVDSIELVGVEGVYRINEVSCNNSTLIVGVDVALKPGARVKGVLPILLKAVGLETVLRMISEVGIFSLVRLGTYAAVNGTVQVPTFNKILCITSSVGVTVSLTLLDKIGVNDVLAFYGPLCPNGQPVSFPQGVDPSFLVELFGSCKFGTKTDCRTALASSLTAASTSICPFCQFIPQSSIANECSVACNAS